MRPLLLASLLLLGAAEPPGGDDEQTTWKGIKIGSRVSRGAGWRYGEQDGGAGRLGTVLELRPWRMEGEDGAQPPAGMIAARVLWDATGQVNAYRWDAPGTGVRDLALQGWRPLSVAEAAVPASYEAAALRAEAMERSSAAHVAPLRGLWDALGGAGWTSQRGWREAFLAGAGGGPAAAQVAMELLPCGGAATAAARGRGGWEGVACSPDFGGVLGLDLSGNGLRGALGAAALEALPAALQSLSLARNAISGELPDAVCRFRDLRFLDVSANALSGPLPGCLGELPALEVLFLAGNAFSGRVPPQWARMRALKALHLQGNERLEPPLPPPLRAMLAGLEHLGLPAALKRAMEKGD